jgi:hypothetical protein
MTEMTNVALIFIYIGSALLVLRLAYMIWCRSWFGIMNFPWIPWGFLFLAVAFTMFISMGVLKGVKCPDQNCSRQMRGDLEGGTFFIAAVLLLVGFFILVNLYEFFEASYEQIMDYFENAFVPLEPSLDYLLLMIGGTMLAIENGFASCPCIESVKKK